MNPITQKYIFNTIFPLQSLFYIIQFVIQFKQVLELMHYFKIISKSQFLRASL
jgi:hypothetical protein